MAGRSFLSSKSPSGPSKADVVALGSSYTPLPLGRAPSGRSLMKALVVLSACRMDPVVVLWWSHYRLPWGGSLWHPWSRWGGQLSFGQGAAWSTWMGWPRMPPSSWLSPSATICGTLPSVRSRVVFLGLLSGPLGRLSRLPRWLVLPLLQPEFFPEALDIPCSVAWSICRWSRLGCLGSKSLSCDVHYEGGHRSQSLVHIPLSCYCQDRAYIFIKLLPLNSFGGFGPLDPWLDRRGTASCNDCSLLALEALWVVNQCWSKLLLKVVHHNIVLLPRNVTNSLSYFGK